MVILNLSTISHQNNVDKVDKSGKGLDAHTLWGFKSQESAAGRAGLPGVSPYFRSGEIEDGQKFFLDVPYSFIYNRAVSGFTGDSMPEPATISVSRGGGGAAVTFFPDT